MSEQKFKKLNTEQVAVLELLYKFRFGSKDLMAQYFGKASGQFMHKRLSILMNQGLITRRFESSYRIQGKPAAYYLLPDGARKLQDPGKEDEVDMRLVYDTKDTEDDQVPHYLNVLSSYINLRDQYGDRLSFFTKAITRDYELFPQPLPDAFLTLSVGGNRHFFLDVLDSSQKSFIITKKAAHYIQFKKERAWDEDATAFPAILFVCESEDMRRRVHRRITKEQYQESISEPVFATTTLQELSGRSEDNTFVWYRTDKPGEKLTLRDIH